MGVRGGFGRVGALLAVGSAVVQRGGRAELGRVVPKRGGWRACVRDGFRGVVFRMGPKRGVASALSTKRF